MTVNISITMYLNIYFNKLLITADNKYYAGSNIDYKIYIDNNKMNDDESTTLISKPEIISIKKFISVTISLIDKNNDNDNSNGNENDKNATKMLKIDISNNIENNNCYDS